MKRLLYLLLLRFLLISCTDLGKNQLQIAQSYLDTYPDSTLIYLEEINPSELSSKVYMEYLLTMTQARHKTGQDISNDTLLFAYKEQFRKFPDHQAAWFYLYTGKIYYEQGNFDKSLAEFIKCEDLITNDLYFSAMLQMSYANLHFSKLELKAAISYYQQAVENFKTIKDWQNTSICYNYLGNCFLYKDSIDKAFMYYDKCTEYKHYWTPLQEAQMIINIAQAYQIKGDNKNRC